jgi:hypothetical protein
MLDQPLIQSDSHVSYLALYVIVLLAIGKVLRKHMTSSNANRLGAGVESSERAVVQNGVTDRHRVSPPP